MEQQVTSFDLLETAVIDVHRGWRGFPRLCVAAADGSHEVEFVHTVDGDPEKSIAFLLSLSEQASLMADEVAVLPVDDSASDRADAAPASAARSR